MESQSTVKGQRYPLSDMQRVHFLMCNLLPHQPVGNLPILFRLHDSVDMHRLARAIEQAVKAHDAFATTIDAGWMGWAGRTGRILAALTDTTRQRVAATFDYQLTVEAVSDLEMQRNMDGALVVPFKTTNSPLFRIRLFQTPTARYLFADVHHAICDGASMPVVIEDIERAYHGQPIESEDYNITDAVLRVRTLQSGEAGARANQWYREKLKGMPHGILPRPDHPGGAGIIRQVVCPLGLSLDHLQQLASNLGGTVNVVTTAAFAILLSQYSGSRQIPLLLAYSARDDQHIARTVGMISRGIVLNTTVENNTLTKDFVTTIKFYMLRGMRNCYYKTSQLMKTDMKWHTAMPFLYHGETTMTPVIGGAPAQRIMLPIRIKGGMPMAVHCMIIDGEAHLMVFYRDDLYSEQYVRQMVADYAKLLY